MPITHPFFLDALNKLGSLEESDLWRWKLEPPFAANDDKDDPHSGRYLKFSRSLASVLHGVKLREQNERDMELRTRFLNSGQEGVAALCTEVVGLLRDWARG